MVLLFLESHTTHNVTDIILCSRVPNMLNEWIGIVCLDLWRKIRLLTYPVANYHSHCQCETSQKISQGLGVFDQRSLELIHSSPYSTWIHCVENHDKAPDLPPRSPEPWVPSRLRDKCRSWRVCFFCHQNQILRTCRFFLKLAFENVESLTSWNKNLRHKICHSTILGTGKIDSMRLEVVFVLESSTRSWSPMLAFPTHAIPFFARKKQFKK